jgi:hypothetical protein
MSQIVALVLYAACIDSAAIKRRPSVLLDEGVASRPPWPRHGFYSKSALQADRWADRRPTDGQTAGRPMDRPQGRQRYVCNYEAGP